MVLRPEAAIAPVISVIIPTYRDLARVAEGLPRVLASEGVTVEVVIVNNDPADRKSVV